MGMKNLTNRENQIMEFVSLGFSDKQIAQKLNLSKHTIATHTGNIYRKLQAQNRAHAINILFLKAIS